MAAPLFGMVRLVGTHADGWIPSIPRMPLEDAAPRMRAIDEAARAGSREALSDT